MPRIRELRVAKEIPQRELAERIGTDESMMSKIERYHCLPIPTMMTKLTDALECKVDDIYEPVEVMFKAPKARKQHKRRKTYHLSVFLPPEARGILKEALPALGYKDITDWVTQAYEKVKRQYESIKKDRSQQPHSERSRSN